MLSQTDTDEQDCLEREVCTSAGIYPGAIAAPHIRRKGSALTSRTSFAAREVWKRLGLEREQVQAPIPGQRGRVDTSSGTTRFPR
jgi:hypothetical protein